MMQKRTLYISLLLVSCLLFFGFSYASAQSVTFQSKTASRCNDVVVNVTVADAGDVSALELVFDVSGDYTSMSVDWAGGFTALNNRFMDVNGSVVRMAALKADAGDACFDGTSQVVAEITLHTDDVCSGAIDIIGTTVTGGCCNAVSASTGLVGCDLSALATTVNPGTITITNQAPTIACADDQTVHWGDLVEADLTGDDADLGNGCESLTYTVEDGPGAIDANGHYTWQTGGDDVCEHEVTVRVTDECGAYAECVFNICVQNTEPVVNNDGEGYFAVWGIELTGSVDATDPDAGPNSLLYSIVSFDGPTWHGSGMTIDNSTGEWTWEIGDDPEYLGDFEVCVKVSDGANLCDPCSPANADTACYSIHVVGFAVTIEKVHDQIQGRNAEVGIYLDSTFMPDVFISDLIGGFDFLIAYDASALTALSAEPGALIDNDDFEYFTYRFGPFGNCGSGCPSGMMRVVGLRETNNGVVNPYHITGPGELVKLNFYVSNDRSLECQYAPIRFFWLDCGDNTLSDETGNWLHQGIKVFDFEGGEITDPVEYGYTGPEAACFDTVYTSDSTFKNAPIGSIYFRNGGVDIVCAADIDDRGDINLNGVENEIADAVVFTNYFIMGFDAFTISIDGQTAATEVNGDGYVLTVADLVYLIRVIVGDANPIPTLKATPNAFADFTLQGSDLNVETNVDLGAVAFTFEGDVNLTLSGSTNMDLIQASDGQYTYALVYSMEAGASINSGQLLTVEGDGTLISAETSEYQGTRVLKTGANVIPDNYELAQNYPNPFNPTTNIELSLPVASDWNISVFNVSGQKVADFGGFSEAGTVNVQWDASGLGSGMYFYKATAGSFSATKKMVLLK